MVEATREAEGVQDLLRVLDDLGLVATKVSNGKGGSGFDAILKVGKRPLPVNVMGDVRDGDVEGLVERMPAHSLVVADRFSPRARGVLQQHEISWLDRRGHLRLVLPPGIFIDRDIDHLIPESAHPVDNPFTRVGLDVAIALLLEPTRRLGVREIAGRTGASAGRVSQLVRQLRELGLVNRDGTPAIPALFEELVGVWNPRWVPLGGRPPPDPTLRLSGAHAAIGHGVPLVVAEGGPVELYVRDEYALRRLVRTYQPDLERTISPVAQVAVCPSPYGFDQARDENLEFPVVNHVVVALDLAQDQGRGREALEQWNPEGVVRVW